MRLPNNGKKWVNEVCRRESFAIQFSCLTIDSVIFPATRCSVSRHDIISKPLNRYFIETERTDGYKSLFRDSFYKLNYTMLKTLFTFNVIARRTL